MSDSRGVTSYWTYIDPVRNRRRWYSVRWQTTLLGGAGVVCNFGRLRFAGGQMQITACDKAEMADAATRAISKRRRQHGHEPATELRLA